MKLTKKQFINCVNEYRQMLNEESQILDVLGGTIEWAPGKWINNYYSLFSEMCELEDNEMFGTDLDWFCFETNFGKYNNIIKLVEESDGAISEIKITDAAQLYDYIMNKEN